MPGELLSWVDSLGHWDPAQQAEAQVNDFDADKGNDDAADPVHQQVKEQQFFRRQGNFVPCSASGTNSGMMMALKMTAARMAL